MTTKTTNILYWIFTIIFAGLMIFSSIGSITMDPAAVKLIHTDLQYPEYFVPFNGWVKMLGSIAILIPGLNKTIKEWAYAGLFFDLIAVIYSSIAIAKGAVNPALAFMLIWIVPGILSYIFWKKKLKTESTLKISHG